MNTKTLIFSVLIVFVTGCGSYHFFKKDETLEPKKGAHPSYPQKNEEMFVCAGDIDVAYKKLGEVSLGEVGFSGFDILAKKIREKASAVGAQAVINVQYDTGASKTWKGYGELGGTDYGVRSTSWCNGTAIEFVESHDPLGLLFCNLNKENRDWFGFKKSQNGAIVVSVLPGSVAANAGIKVQDLITEWNGIKVENKRHLTRTIANTSGKKTKIILLRAGDIKIVSLSVPIVEDYRFASSPSKIPQPFTEEKKPTIERKESYPNKEFYPTNKFDSKASVTYNEKGDLYLRKGMYYAAMEEYKKAIAADPNNAIAHFNLSIAYDKKGMKEEADAEYAIYKRLKPKRN